MRGDVTGTLKLKPGGWLVGVAVFLAVMALVAGAFLIARSERGYELGRWNARLQHSGIQRVAKVNQWLADSRHGLQTVAENPTVQIFLSEIAAANFDTRAVPESDAKAAFLQSYIASLSVHGAYAANVPPDMPMGSTMQSSTGLAVLDGRRHVVASTFGYTPSPALIASLLAAMKDDQAGPQSFRAGGDAVNAFIAAIRPLQAPPSAQPIGYVIGARKLEAGFWSADSAPLSTERGHESLFAVDAHSAPMLLGSSAKVAQIGDAGEARAALAPGHLFDAPDFAGQDSFHLAIAVPSTSWAVVESVPARTALAGVDARVRTLALVLLLALVAIILAVLALWRHMAGVEAAKAHETSLKIYRSVVEVLLEAIDQRDPGAAAHSRRVAALARAVALKMGKTSVEADRLELAGALLNVGKLFVPSEMLTKQGALDDSERVAFDRGAMRWLDLLARMPFDPPLEPVLREAYRLMRPGTEPSAGNDAYIIVMANRAVALTSPRAYRQPHSVAETIELLSPPSVALPQSLFAALRAALGESI